MDLDLSYELCILFGETPFTEQPKIYERYRDDLGEIVRDCINSVNWNYMSVDRKKELQEAGLFYHKSDDESSDDDYTYGRCYSDEEYYDEEEYRVGDDDFLYDYTNDV